VLPRYQKKTCFDHFKNIAKIDLPGSLEIIDSEAFAFTSIASIYIPSIIASIGEGVFMLCTNLKAVV